MVSSYFEVDPSERYELEVRLTEEARSNNIPIKVMKSPLYGATYADLELMDCQDDEVSSYNIRIGRFIRDQSNILPIISIAHELGHYYDITRNHGGSIKSFFDSGVMNYETTAWENAIDILNKHGMTHWNAFRRYAFECLSTYALEPKRWIVPQDDFPIEEFKTYTNRIDQKLISLGLVTELEEINVLAKHVHRESF